MSKNFSTTLPDKDKWSELMESAQNGDKKAYEKLLNEIIPFLRKYLARRLFDHEFAEDVLQDVLLAIHKVRHTYRPERPFERWMYGVARHKMIDALRKYKRLKDREYLDKKIETLSNDKTNNGTEWFYDLEWALDKIPKKHKKVIVLAKIKGHSVAEVAEKLKMSESAVKVTTHRAFRQLREILSAYED